MEEIITLLKMHIGALLNTGKQIVIAIDGKLHGWQDNAGSCFGKRIWLQGLPHG